MDKSRAWADFWKGGSLTSFGDRFAKGYEGEIRQLWLDTFMAAPADAVIVDFGAGNGALEEIAFEASGQREAPLTMHAFDLAPELPARFETPEKASGWQLEWHPGSRNEDTGLADNSVDLVIGNYAFEYGDDAATVSETARILKPGGRAAFLMHHADSNIIKGAQVELKVLDEVLGKGGFLSVARDYLAEFGNIRHPRQFEKFRKSGKGEPLRQKLNERHGRAVKHCETENAVKLMSDISQWIGQLLQPPGLFEEKQLLIRRLKQVREYLEANRERLKDMQRAAVDEARRDRLLNDFRDHGVDGEASVFNVADSDAPVGWYFNLSRGN